MPVHNTLWRRLVSTVAVVLAATCLALIATERAEAQDAEAADLLREAVASLEAGDNAAYDQITETAVASAAIPPAIVDAFAPRDTEAILLGAELLELDDRALYERAIDVLTREQATLPDRAQSGPPESPQPGEGRPRDQFLVDVEGAATLELLDLRGLEVPESARVPMAMMPDRGEEPGPRPVQFEAARREFTELIDLTYDEHDGGHLTLILVISAATVAAAIAVVAVVRKNRSEHLAALALTDSLTGLRNRRRLDQDLELQRRCEHGTTALLMIDVDHFKAFNDTHGHATGDEVLRLVGAAIESSVREDDITYRYGGEEFCVLLPGTDDYMAADIGDRVRKAIEEIRVAGSPVTASVGVAAGQAREVDAIATSADRALYDAKAAGRNRVVVAESLAPNL